MRYLQLMVARSARHLSVFCDLELRTHHLVYLTSLSLDCICVRYGSYPFSGSGSPVYTRSMIVA